jgi:hypothetical protein
MDTDVGATALHTLERLRRHIEQQRQCPSAPQWQATFSASLAVHAANEPCPIY